MADIYSEIRLDVRWMAEYLEARGIEYHSYNHGVQFNVVDSAGVIHSFYPTTGTLVLHEGNERNKRKTVTLRNQNMYQLINYILDPEEIQRLIRKENK